MLLLSTGATAASESARFRPPVRSVNVDAGRAARLDFTLELSARRTQPLDVYLLVDTSLSMSVFVDSHRQQLADVVTRMARSGRDVQFGVGEFRTVGTSDWLQERTYRRLLSISPAGPQTYQALGRLGEDTRGFTPSGYADAEAHTIALEQAVRGDGHFPYVDPGHQAGFRPQARKVIVMLTDEPFGGSTLSQPTIEEAIEALQEAGVQFVGIAIEGEPVRDHLAEVAGGTGSRLATGVDCGGPDGRVQAGEPAACVATGRSAGAAVERMLGALGTRLSFAATGSASVVRRVTPVERWIDPSRPNRIPVQLELSCAGAERGTAYRADLTAALAGQVLAKARADLRCR
jgi:hypothetical protein